MLGRILGLCGMAAAAASIIVPSVVGGMGSDAGFGGILAGLAAIVLGGLLMTRGGRAGYYDIRDDESLGMRLPREEVDVSGWTRMPLGQAAGGWTR